METQQTQIQAILKTGFNSIDELESFIERNKNTKGKIISLSVLDGDGK